MNLLINNAGFFLQGLLTTLALAGVTLAGSTLIGVLVGAIASSRFAPLRWLMRAYIELLRGIPLIVNIFFVFFGAPLLGLDFSPFTAVTLGLSLWGGANAAELVRGALNAVPLHQVNSGRALGLKGWEVLLFISGPQAFKHLLPAYVGLLTLLLQSTTLGAIVGVGEFFRVGQLVVERTSMMDGYNPAPAVYALILLVYFLLCSVLTALGRRLERKLKHERVALAPTPENTPALTPN
ncbi:amino acid ABC transporter permease [Pseudomonas sp. DSP3-2-2]|uniref:amino acid ABC transporter permease n=1 Tax=unclassified Pseudomonas TaxID=196821 RepID=UPI003CE7CC31